MTKNKNSIINKIFNVHENSLTKKKLNHDVVVINHNKNNRTCLVKTITSLERKNNKNTMEYLNLKLKLVKQGKIIPIPIKDLGSKHWSGIDVSRPIVVSEKDLKESLFCKKNKDKKIPSKYLRIIR